MADSQMEEEPYLERFNILSPLTFADPALVRTASGAVVASDSWQIEGRLLKSILLKSDRHGELSVRDCLSPWAAELKLSLPSGTDRSVEFVHEVRLDAATLLPEMRQSIQSAISGLEGIEAVFKIAQGTLKPKFDYLLRLLKAAKNVLDDTITSVAPSSTVGTSPPTSGSGSVTSAGPVSNREEAVRRLAEVADYFRRNEPSSPIPLLIKRVQTLVGHDFGKLIQDLALGKEAVDKFNLLVGPLDEKSGPATPK